MRALMLIYIAVLALGTTQVNAADSSRVTRDLQALYTFEDGRGDVVRDRSGVGRPLDLKIDKLSGVQWRKGALVVRSSTRISSAAPAKKIVDAVKLSNAVTIEAWVQPSSDAQSGPARIVSLSTDISQRNFTLGQDGKRYDVRLRTTSTSANGIPSTAAPNNSVKTSLTHVVYTRDEAGNARLYINGQQQASEIIAGKLSGWSDKFRLSLANELTGDRPWLGELHLVAIYSRALDAKEVGQNFAAGSKSATSAPVAAKTSRSSSPQVSGGLSALYTFEAGRGYVVQDRSGSGPPLDLKIEKPSAVQWQDGALVVRSSTRVASSQPATKIIDSVRRSGAATVEAWVKPANNSQDGPARIVSLSSDPSNRNFTLGQDAKFFEVRYRTSKTDNNGHPTTVTKPGTATTELTHVVYTRDKSGTTRIFLNGRKQAGSQVAGNLGNWKTDFPLVLANEFTNDRPWLGELHLVAVYSRALNAREVAQNFNAGAKGKAVSPEQLMLASRQRHFETHIAPLLAKSCLKCHDSASKKGRLDLSRKTAALAGGESGKVIIPGKSADSLLWEQIRSGDMPPEGKPLSVAEKTLLKNWLDNGAVWSIDVIDPATYAHDDNAGEIWLQRLTISEYIETVRSAVGVDIVKEAREILPPDLRADGFSNTAYNLNVDLKHVEAYARLAEIIVERMDVLKFAARFSKSRSLNTDATARQFVEAMGKWLFRGPLTNREEVIYSGIMTAVASAGGSYEDGVALTIEAMLQSPRFIYRIEDQRGEGPVDDYELASRLSYIIWGGPPDSELMRAADAGNLSEHSQVQQQVGRMLKELPSLESRNE